jgi:hypothetical protein
MMVNMEKAKLRLQFVATLITRTFNYPYCEEWDKQLNYLLDTYSNTSENVGYTLKLGDFRVWVGHFPYATGSLFTTGHAHTELGTRRRPSFKTMLRLMEVYKINS